MVADLDAGLSTAAAGKTTEKMEKVLQSYPEVTKVYSTVTAEQTNIFVKLVDKHERNKTIDELAMDMRHKLNTIPGVKVTINQQAGMSDGAAVQFRLLGDDLDQLQVYAEQAQKIMESIPGAVDVSSSFKPGKPEAQIQIKQDVAATWV
ncbi:hypothetical protein P378_20520 [Desulforamulus profundi]|uniref:Uncharacterized protein n=1 Tax=Desulforamulus profundi TaxID=1383067 RepID=A0A2C6L1B0_9FIRM|nr:hypothetical protein P378_20520 [Desulforamulus profundi]